MRLRFVAPLACMAVFAAVAETERPTYELVSLTRLTGAVQTWGGMQRSPGRVRVPHDSVEDIIALAFEVQPEQIAGLPDWSRLARYDIVLAAPEATFVGPAHGEARAQQMLRALLAERFKLVFHRDRRPLVCSSLVIGPGGVKMRAAPAGPDAWQEIDLDGRHLVGRGAPMERLARIVSLSMSRPVLDRTGLTETYDFDAQWPADRSLSPHRWLYSGAQSPAPAPVTQAPSASFEEALRDQLGLVLEPATSTMVDFIVVDRIDEPQELALAAAGSS